MILLYDLLLKLSPCLRLFFSLFKSSLVFSFLLLVFHHLFNTCSLKLFLLFLHHDKLLLFALLHFQALGLIELFLEELFLGHHDTLLDIVFHVLVPFQKHPLLKLFFSLSMLLQTRLLLITLLNTHYVFCFLLSLFNFFPSLIRIE